MAKKKTESEIWWQGYNRGIRDAKKMFEETMRKTDFGFYLHEEYDNRQEIRKKVCVKVLPKLSQLFNV